MGEPMDRSKRVFGKLSTFEDVFPTLEQVEVTYVETDLFENEKRKGHWWLHGEGGLMPCGNPRCRRGGYELDLEVSKMLREGVTQKQVKIRCRGDEGSPKGRKKGESCTRTLDATIVLKPKVASG